MLISKEYVNENNSFASLILQYSTFVRTAQENPESKSLP